MNGCGSQILFPLPLPAAAFGDDVALGPDALEVLAEELQESIDYIAGRAEIEVSGNVTKENIARLTGLGVNYVSSGALTHSAPIMDLSMKNLHPVE